MTLADFRDYVNAQARAEKAWLDQDNWTRMSIINTASSARFSSDRTIGEYFEEIWQNSPGC